jgi:hypothetical protein
VFVQVGRLGLEPRTHGLKVRCSTIELTPRVKILSELLFRWPNASRSRGVAPGERGSTGPAFVLPGVGAVWWWLAGRQARAGPSRASIWVQAVSSQAMATSSHQIWFWA